MAWQTQEPVTFEDVAVYLSRVEWDGIAAGQRELYRRVMLDNYELLMSLGYPGPKPDVLHRLERGEEPWVCTPQSTFRWDGPDSPSPGHNGKGRCLEEPSPSWWPGAGGCHVLGERTQPPCQGGRCVPWRLRSSRVLSKLRRHEAAVAGRAAGPLPQPGTGEAEDRGGVPGNGPRSGRFPLQPVSERQNKEVAPQDRLLGGCMPGRRGGQAPEQPGDSSTVLRDHCYCLVGGERPRALRDHDYCRRVLASARLLLDHQYCCIPPVNCQELCRAPWTSGTNRARRREPSVRHSRIQRLVHKAKRTLWRREASTGPADPRGSSWHTSRHGRMLSMLYLRVEMLRSQGRRPRVMSGEASESPAVASESPAVASEPPASDTAGEVEEEAEVPSAVETRAERGERVNPSYLSQLRDAYDVMLRRVGCTFCHNLERGGCSLRKDVRPVGIGLNG